MQAGQQVPVFRGPATAFGSAGRAPVPARKVRVFAGSEQFAASAGAAEAGGVAQEEKQYSSVGQSTVNVVKNVVGAGMFSLPSGVAAFSGSPAGLVPAVSVSMLLAIASAYGFVLIADACKRTGENTYQGAWGKTVGTGKWIPTLACTGKAAIGCISFSMILGDCLSMILAPWVAGGWLPAALCSRSAVILLLTAFVLLPLCSLKSLAPLAKFSVLGVLSNVYICGFVLLRYLDGSYSAEHGGRWLAQAPAVPKFTAATGSAWSLALHPGFLVLLSIMGTAFLAHYNAPNFYEQLAPDRDGKKDRSFFVVSVLGFSISAMIFCTVMCGGFLTFGQSSLGLILNNYAETDPLAVLARLAIAVSLLTAYPIVFFSLKKQFVALMGDTGEAWARESPRELTIGLVTAVMCIALYLRNLGKLTAFAGALFGSFLIYVGPALMMICAQQRGLGPKGSGPVRLIQSVMVPLGIALGGLGAVMSLK